MKLRIVHDRYNNMYLIQSWRWWFPIWNTLEEAVPYRVDMYGNQIYTKAYFSLEAAKEMVKKIKDGELDVFGRVKAPKRFTVVE